MRWIRLERVRDRSIEDVKAPVDQLVFRFTLQTGLVSGSLLRPEEVAYAGVTLDGVVTVAVGSLECRSPAGVGVNPLGDRIVETCLVSPRGLIRAHGWAGLKSLRRQWLTATGSCQVLCVVRIPGSQIDRQLVRRAQQRAELTTFVDLNPAIRGCKSAGVPSARIEGARGQARIGYQRPVGLVHIKSGRAPPYERAGVRLDAEHRLRAISSEKKRLLVAEGHYVTKQVHFARPLGVSLRLPIEVDVGSSCLVCGDWAEVAHPDEFLLVVGV